MKELKTITIVAIAFLMSAMLFQNCSDPNSSSRTNGKKSTNSNPPQGGGESEAQLDRRLIADIELNEVNSNVPPQQIVENMPQNEIDQHKASITRYYNFYLGRAPDQEGLNFWVEAIVVSGLTLSEVETHIRNSDEAAIRGFYRDHLGREPDAAGRDYYLNQVDTGALTLSGVEASIMNSIEAQIRSYYLTHLLREPDLSGMEYWRGHVEQKTQTLAEVRMNIRLSEECKAQCL